MKIECYGTPNKPSILCIPGVFMSGDSFQNLIAQLPDYHFVCVTLDAHHPGSDEFEGLTQEVDKLIRQLQSRKLTQFDLAIGLSLGTILSVCVAARTEISIKQLMLDGAVSFYTCPSKLFERAAMSAMFRHFMRKARKSKLPKQQFSGDMSACSEICMRTMTPASLKTIIRLLSDFVPAPGLTQPIYCLYGSRENNISANQTVIKKCFPQAVFSVKQGCHHLEFFNRHPDEYADIVRSLLTSPSVGDSL